LHASLTHNRVAEVDHTPHVHPASPSAALPESFASYRKKAQQHGPLNPGLRSYPSIVGGHIGGAPGTSLGRVEASSGEYFDRSELPARFQRLSWTPEEMEAIESGGASVHA
jgi:small subunit ribosomal protein YMR-31